MVVARVLVRYSFLLMQNFVILLLFMYSFFIIYPKFCKDNVMCLIINKVKKNSLFGNIIMIIQCLSLNSSWSLV
jgi:hypothetical protein